MKIKSGDMVRIRTGKDKGKQGKVLQVFPDVGRVVVEGINMMTKHLRKGANRPGQKIQFASPVHVSNVSLISPKTGKTGRVGYKKIQTEGKRKTIRIIKKRGETEDIE
jgi:large subunit ribosomal protein L24